MQTNIPNALIESAKEIEETIKWLNSPVSHKKKEQPIRQRRKKK